MAAPSSLLLAALLWVPAEALSCYGDSGRPVDWFVVYKLPANSGSGDKPWKGLMYKYMDQNSEGWQDGVGHIDSKDGAVGLTLQPLYQKNSSQVSCSWTKKGASGWSTVCLASHPLHPLVHTAGLRTLGPTARPYSVCPFPSVSFQGLASN
uniref:Deoxyribonuclease-2-alpha n=1 Tax=Rattus norvegicus TaxID=10116 RepID=A0A8I6ASI3_RAT